MKQHVCLENSALICNYVNSIMLVVFNNRFYLCSRITYKPARLQDDSDEEEEKDDDGDMAVSKNRGRSGKKCHPIFQRAPTPPPVPGIYLSVIIGDCIFKEIMQCATIIYSYVFLVLYFYFIIPIFPINFTPKVDGHTAYIC